MKGCPLYTFYYTAIGTDATVNYPYADFKFRNNKDTPIFITRYISGGRLHVEIYGKPSEEYDKIEIVAMDGIVKYLV